jgi:hypothetical protein
MTYLVTLLVALIVPLTSAQAPPDFSGTWRMDLERSESPTYEQFIGPVTVVITQTPSEVRIETTRGSAPEAITSTATYEFGDPERAATIGVTSAGSLAFWEGTTLVTAGVTTVQGQTVRTRERRVLDPGRGEMRVESLLIVEHGYTLEGTNNYGKAEDVFTRVPGGAY